MPPGLRPLLPLLLLAATSGPLAAQQPAEPPPIPAVIEGILAQPAAERTLWGILVRDLESGDTVYARNQDKLFLPASNAKLFSTALALSRLGGDYRLTTRLAVDGTVSEEGVLEGDLRLIGGGDPNLSSRILPFRKSGEFAPDRLAPLRELARRVADAGIRRISGDIVGDDSRYVWQPYPRGWSHADTLRGYGSAASALAFNDNLVEIRVTPGAVGEPARARVSPALGYLELANLTQTTSGRHVSRTILARRGEGPRRVILAGQIPSRSRGRTMQLAADDPAEYAATALRRALLDAGIEVGGGAVASHLLPDRLATLRTGPPDRPPGTRPALAEIPSVSLREAIRVVNKESQNLHAEILLREVAYRESGIGSQEAAVASMRRFLAEVGLGTTEFYLVDGSGLSRHNLIAPTAAVRLLEYMWNSASRDAYLDSLPVAGEDGTLDWRFRGTPARGRVHAKTGSMSHVLALSGYARDGDGKTYAFAIMANNFGLASSSTRRLVDSIAAALASSPAS